MTSFQAQSGADSLVSSVRVPEHSRYKDTALVRRTSDNRLEWALWEADQALTDADTALHQVRDYEIGRLDLISYRYYGTVSYWWVIADANAMIHPICDMRVGGFIRIPPIEAIERFIQRTSNINVA
jgi:hypothetical protein